MIVGGILTQKSAFQIMKSLAFNKYSNFNLCRLDEYVIGIIEQEQNGSLMLAKAKKLISIKIVALIIINMDFELNFHVFARVFSCESNMMDTFMCIIIRY